MHYLFYSLLAVTTGRATYSSSFSSLVVLEHCSNHLFPRFIQALNSNKFSDFYLFTFSFPCLLQLTKHSLCWNFEFWFWSNVISAVLVRGLSNFDDMTAPSDLCLKFWGWAVTTERFCLLDAHISSIPVTSCLVLTHPDHKYCLPLLWLLVVRYDEFWY